MRKHLYLLALIVSACASPEEIQRQEQQFTDDIEAVGEERQTSYYACAFGNNVWECRQPIWEKAPKPHIPGHEQREFIRRYFDAIELRGAANVLKAEHLPCGTVKSVGHSLWRDGQRAECSDGHQYQILRDNGIWHITPVEEDA